MGRNPFEPLGKTIILLFFGWPALLLSCGPEGSSNFNNTVSSELSSDCEYLNGKCYRPMGPVLVDPSHLESGTPLAKLSELRLLRYDPGSNQVSELEVSQMELPSAEERGGSFPEEESITEAAPLSMSQVTRPWEHIFYKTVVKLYLDFPKGGAACSGTMIGRHTVLTAGHCVYDHPKDQGGNDFGGWAVSANVYPAMAGPQITPFGWTSALYFMTTGWWIDNRDFRGDIAVIQLYANIGDRTSWPVLYYDYSSTSGPINEGGYPGGGAYDGNWLYFTSGTIKRVDEYQIVNTGSETTHGMSGGPSWFYYTNPESRKLTAVVSGGNESGENFDTRYRSGIDQFRENSESQSAVDHTSYWTCDLNHFDADDGCDCECGLWDPDCDGDQSNSNCGEQALCVSPGVCKSTCVCSSGPCCDGCYPRRSDMICNAQVAVQYFCSYGTNCGDDVFRQVQKQYCPGNSSDCSGVLIWGMTEVYDNCSSSERCVEGSSSCQTDSSCNSSDNADFVSDVTIPDGTVIIAGTSFLKTWRMQNNGTTTWTPDAGYGIAFESGEQFGALSFTVLKPGAVVGPGQMVDIEVSMVAPLTPGTYRGYWHMEKSGAGKFGDRVWVEIQVEPETTCVCTSGACCDGCNYKPTDEVCEEDYSTEYTCRDGTACGQDVFVRHQDLFCSGNSEFCDGELIWDTEQLFADCTMQERCSPGNSACLPDPGCTGSCVCTSGDCCDGCAFRPSSFACGQEIAEELSCQDGNGCGQTVYKRQQAQFCSGTSSACDGETRWSGWSIDTICQISEQCDSDHCAENRELCPSASGESGCGCATADSGYEILFGGIWGVLVLFWLRRRR